MSLAIDIEARRRVQIKEYEGKKYMAIDCDDLFDSQKNEIKLDAEKKGWIYLGRHEKFPDRLLFTRNKKDERELCLD